MAFTLSRQIVEGVLRLKPDWVRPRHARRDITEGLFGTIVGYAAEKRAGGLPDGKGTALLAMGSLDREFRDTMRTALGLYDALIGHMTVELRDWVLKARKRTREYPWGSLFAEGEWLWVIPKAQPIDTWASPREEKPTLVELKPKKTMIEIQVKGRAGTGKTTFSQEIAHTLREYGFDVVVEDIDKPASDAVQGLRLGSLRKHMRMNNGQILVKVVQTPRTVTVNEKSA